MGDLHPTRTAAHLVAEEFHRSYESLAPAFGYRTREESAVPWVDVPLQNRALMVATVMSLLGRGIIEVGPRVREMM